MQWEEETEKWQNDKQDLEQKLNTEILLKKQSVNKLVQVMTMKKNQPDEKDAKGGASRKMLKVIENF